MSDFEWRIEVRFSKIRKKNAPQFVTQNQERCDFLLILKKKFFSEINSIIYQLIFPGEFFFSSYWAKKNTFLDFKWRIGVRFFFQQNIKNATQFVNQNPTISRFWPAKKKNLHFLAIRSLILNHLLLTFDMKYLEF